MSNKVSPWFITTNPNPDAVLRLICLPYAGGHASVYSAWAKLLPDTIEVVAIQLPGRANRFSEKAYTSMDDLIRALYADFIALLDKPYAIFGHSLGSRIGFELLRVLMRDHRLAPARFIASGGRPPHLPALSAPLSELSDEDLIKKLKKFNGTPSLVLENAELLELYLPLLRADFKLAESHQLDAIEKLHCPVSVFSGIDDVNIPEEDMLRWRDLFHGDIKIDFFEGDHFFIEQQQEKVVHSIADILQQDIIVA